MRTFALSLLGLLSLGCGPTTSLDDDTGSSSGADPTTDETGPPPATTTSTAVDATDTSTTDEPPDDDSSGEEGGTEGCTFTCPDPPPPPPMGGMCNCPEGEKCMPWANDGGTEWTAIRCSPIADDPGAPGDPCTVEGGQYSGIDDCEYGALCYGIDPETNRDGVCVSFCSWLGDEPCGPGTECQTQPGELGVPFCVPTCDPTAPDCPEGAACFAGGSSFTCQPTAESRQPVGAPCPTPADCVAGALCAYGLDCGQAEGEGCCAEVCELGMPDPCLAPAMCTPWFGGAGGPEWDHVGYCAG